MQRNNFYPFGCFQYQQVSEQGKLLQDPLLSCCHFMCRLIVLPRCKYFKIFFRSTGFFFLLSCSCKATLSTCHTIFHPGFYFPDLTDRTIKRAWHLFYEIVIPFHDHFPVPVPGFAFFKTDHLHVCFAPALFFLSEKTL